MDDTTASPKQTSSRADLAALIRPGNLLKTISSLVPGTAAFAQMLDQIEGERVEKRLTSLEARREQEIKRLEQANPPPPPTIQDWSYAASQLMNCTAELTVFYDAAADPIPQPGRRVFLTVAHACIFDEKTIVTATSAIEFAVSVAKHKRGVVMLVAGFAHYHIALDKRADILGVSVCRILGRDEAEWRKVEETWKSHGLDPIQADLPKNPPKFTVTPWIGQEIGFLHTGEAENIMRDFRLTPLQFSTSAISHFRRPSDVGLKVFVTGVLGSRFLGLGSPVFSRDATLLGVVAGDESYTSDGGRRAIVNSLLGHPQFTKGVVGNRA